MAFSLFLWSYSAMALVGSGGCRDTCEDLCPSRSVALQQVLGEWHMLMGYSTADIVTAFCKTLDVTLHHEDGVQKAVRLSWSTSGQSEPIVNTSLQVIQPGYWEQEDPGTMVVKVLALLSDQMTLAFCDRASAQHVASSYQVLVLIRQQQIPWRRIHALRSQLAQESTVDSTSSGYICTAALDFSSEDDQSAPSTVAG